MMKMYKSIFYFLFIVIISVSCGKEKLPTEPYFKFDAIGEQLLSGIKLNDTIKFAGTNGSNRQYLVFKIEKERKWTPVGVYCRSHTTIWLSSLSARHGFACIDVRTSGCPRCLDDHVKCKLHLAELMMHGRRVVLGIHLSNALASSSQ